MHKSRFDFANIENERTDTVRRNTLYRVRRGTEQHKRDFFERYGMSVR